MLPRLNSCCCGCTLETGTKIIAVLQIIGTIIVLSTASALADYLSDPSLFPGQEDAAQVLYAVYVTIAVITSIQLLFAILLLIGASMRRSGFMLPWLIYMGVVLLLTFILMIINAVNATAGGLGGSIAYGVISIGVQIYFFLVVYSHYKDVCDGVMPRGTV